MCYLETQRERKIQIKYLQNNTNSKNISSPRETTQHNHSRLPPPSGGAVVGWYDKVPLSRINSCSWYLCRIYLLKVFSLSYYIVQNTPHVAVLLDLLLGGGSPTTSHPRCTRSPMDYYYYYSTRFTFPAILKLLMYAMAGWRFLYTSTYAPPCYRTHYYSRFMAPNPIKWITSTPIHRASKVWTTETTIRIIFKSHCEYKRIQCHYQYQHIHTLYCGIKVQRHLIPYQRLYSLSVPHHHPPATLATAVLLMFTELLKRVYRERCTRWWRLTRQVQSPPTPPYSLGNI